MRRPRGGATVETALLLLVLVPTFFYAVLLDDLLRFKLDLQEAVLSSPWDFTTQNYQSGVNVWSVQHNNRLMWCDHTSAYDSYDQSYDCDGSEHHRSVGAHICWLQREARQVTCTRQDADLGASYGDMTAGSFKSRFNNGGMFSCRARAAVLNYLVPQAYMQHFAQVDHLDREKFENEGAVHSDAAGATSLEVYVLEEQAFGLVTDPWALNVSENRRGGEKSGALHDRVAHIYRSNPGYFMAAMRGPQLVMQGMQDQLISPLVLMDGMGDDTTNPNVAVQHADDAQPPPVSVQQDVGSGDYYATPWQDWDLDKPAETHQNRGPYYMGNESEESD